ncbi:MAG: 4-hydroxyphenylpyruvate dioxygenase [Chloroflexi bacterium]|nr:4-hydroxyphenylpyruvate dioxygenase [Chloroflexota bacterium]
MQRDTVPIEGIDHIHFIVGNARQAAYFYRMGMGFDVVAYAGPETGRRDVATYVLEQGDIRLAFSTPLRSAHPYARFLRQHGDGVKEIAFRTPDATRAFELAAERGAARALWPRREEDEAVAVVLSGIAIYGDTTHLFVERREYQGPFLPGFEPLRMPGRSVGLRAIDHVVANVELGQMNHWVDFYRSVLGFEMFVSFDDKDISTEYSALMSRVMADGNGRIKLPINEPAPGKRRSQIDEFLEYYEGPGVQHIALATDDIVATVTDMQARGIEFLAAPDDYYRQLPDRVGRIDEDFATLKRLGVLVDRDDEGYLLQIFTRPVEDRPTVFYEVIQRKGAKGFGKGNFRALFEAIEREQARRGNL